MGTTDAASEGTVTYRRIKTVPQLRPGEVIQLVPGMVVTQHSGDGKANQYFLRGYNLDHGTDFAIWVDGMPVNMPTHAHGQGYADINFMIPELIQGIDFRKGPYYADEGDFSSVGAAHIRYFDVLPQNIGAGDRGNGQLPAGDGGGVTEARRRAPADRRRGNGLRRSVGGPRGPAQAYNGVLRYRAGRHGERLQRRR